MRDGWRSPLIDLRNLFTELFTKFTFRNFSQYLSSLCVYSVSLKVDTFSSRIKLRSRPNSMMRGVN